MSLALALYGAAQALAVTPPPLLDAVARGDALWAAHRRAEARDAWQEAATSVHPATVAMAEARLLQVSGNLGLAVHGPRLDRALARCPPGTPWCAVAHFDALFFTHRLGLGPAPAPLSKSLDGGAAWTAAVEERRSWTAAPPPRMPTWTLGLSPFGASGYGFGAAVVFRNPDLGLRGGHLVASAGATLSDDHQVTVSLDSPGRVWAHVDAQSRQTTLAPVSAMQVPPSWRSHGAAVGPGVRMGPVSAWLGPRFWIDTAATSGQSVGLTTQLAWTPAPLVRVDVQAQAMRGHAQVTHATIDASHRPRASGLAVRGVLTTTTATPDTPVWRQPGWGGGTVMRHGSYLQYQAPWMAAAIAEWRQEVIGPLQLAAFTEAGWMDTWAAAGGLGAALALPPRPSSTVRLDAAWGGPIGGGPGSWGLSAGWGQAF